jgi:hypothetical protein
MLLLNVLLFLTCVGCVCLCNGCSFEICLGLLAGGVVALVVGFVRLCYQKGRMFPRLVVLTIINKSNISVVLIKSGTHQSFGLADGCYKT